MLWKKIVRAASLSARRAWIEIAPALLPAANTYVALRKESVDRNNTKSANFKACITVALRKESVDRNIFQCGVVAGRLVALRKESVDRN